MGWVRDDGGGGASADAAAKTARIRYLLDGVPDPAAVAFNPSAYLGGASGSEPLPACNSTYPMGGHPALLLDRYDVDTDGAVAAVVALYSTDRRFRFPAFNQEPATGYRFMGTTETYVFGLPYAAKCRDEFLTYPLSGTGPPSATYADKWVALTEQFMVKAQRISLRMRIPDDRVLAALDICYDLQQTVMPFAGRLWLFEGASIDEGQAAGDYRFSLEFLREKGTKIDYAAYPPNTWLPEVPGKYPGFPDAMARPAFHKTILMPRQDGSAELPPGFEAIPGFDFAADGFAQLESIFP